MQNEMKPIYAIGDRVLITNPIDIFEVEDTTVYTIADVKFNEKHCTYFYRINSRWVNESWLEPDLFGPQYLDDDKPELDAKQALKAEQEYMLASLYDAMSRKNITEQFRSIERLKEIHAELEAIE